MFIFFCIIRPLTGIACHSSGIDANFLSARLITYDSLSINCQSLLVYIMTDDHELQYYASRSFSLYDDPLNLLCDTSSASLSWCEYHQYTPYFVQYQEVVLQSVDDTSFIHKALQPKEYTLYESHPSDEWAKSCSCKFCHFSDFYLFHTSKPLFITINGIKSIHRDTASNICYIKSYFLQNKPFVYYSNILKNVFCRHSSFSKLPARHNFVTSRLGSWFPDSAHSHAHMFSLNHKL